MSNPYTPLDDHGLWARAMVSMAPGHVDPAVKTPRIAPTDLIASMGSCFAQHLVCHTQGAGLRHLDTAPPPAGLDSAAAREWGSWDTTSSSRAPREYLVFSYKRYRLQGIEPGDITVLWRDESALHAVLSHQQERVR